MCCDVTAIGELLIDFTPVLAEGEPAFLPKPGGAPANVAAAVRKLGGKSAFLGKVGQDSFGHFLKDALEREGVETAGLRMDADAPTTLAFVHLAEEGERSFTFYRRHCADTLLRREELDWQRIAQSRVLHFGSVSLTEEPARGAVLAAAEYARQQGVLVSFDPNIRPALWESEQAALQAVEEALRFADIVKVSQEEMELITGEADPAAGTQALAERGAALAVVTLGAQGAVFRRGDAFSAVPAFAVHAVDTNGAGDAFFGALLYQLTRTEQPLALPAALLEEAVRFACAAGGLTATRHGAISALPTREMVCALLQRNA